MTAESAALRAEHPGAETMAVGPIQPLLKIVVVGRASISEALEGERDLVLIHASGTLDALGELGKIEPTGPSPVVVLDPATVRAPDIGDFVIAARRLHPTVRFLGVGSQQDPIAGIERWALPDSTRLEWLVHIGRLPLDPPRLPLEPESAEPAVKPVSASAGDEAPLLHALLSGGDVVQAAVQRLRAGLAPHEVSFIQSTNAARRNVSEPLSPHDTRIEVRHRDRLFGWLVGPRAHEARLVREASLMALWIALQEQQAALRSAALTDALTGAWNRRYFDRYLEASIVRAKRRRNDVTLLLFDLDDFKSYNDRYGHAAGDEILRETVRLLGSVIRPTDRVCRIGGDEFAVIFDDPDGPRDPSTRHPASIVQIARRFQAQIREHRFPKLGQEAAGRLTITAAMATYPWDASDAAALLEQADRLLLEAKSQGKNTVNMGPESPR